MQIAGMNETMAPTCIPCSFLRRCRPSDQRHFDTANRQHGRRRIRFVPKLIAAPPQDEIRS